IRRRENGAGRPSRPRHIAVRVGRSGWRRTPERQRGAARLGAPGVGAGERPDRDRPAARGPCAVRHGGGVTTPDGSAPFLDAARAATALDRALQPAGADLVESIAATARSVFGAAACSIALLTDDGSELVFTTALGGAAETIAGMRIPSDQGIA